MLSFNYCFTELKCVEFVGKTNNLTETVRISGVKL